MAMIVIGSAKGAPGVTTMVALLASVWPSRVVVADCDPSGGDLAVGWLSRWWLDGRVHDRRGLLSFVTATRHEARVTGDMLAEHLQEVPGASEVRLLAGLRDRAQGASITDDGWRRLADALGEASRPSPDTVDVLVDGGRFGAGIPWPLVVRADLVLLAVRPQLRHLVAARPVVMALRERVPAARLGVAVCATQPAAVAQVQQLLGVAVGLALPEDPRSARVFSDGVDAAGRVRRSALVRIAARGAHRLHVALNLGPGSVSAAPVVPASAAAGVR